MILKYQDIDINYYDNENNNKDPVIFLHGWGSSLETFKYTFKMLNDTSHVYAVDFPGFGESKINRAFSLDDYVKFLIYFITELNIKNYTIVAHSFGGRVAIKYLGKHQINNPQGLILVDSAGIKHITPLKVRIKILNYKIKKAYYKTFKKEAKLSQLYSKSGSEDYQNSSVIMKDTMRNVIKEDLRKYLPNINIDTLIIWGKEDKTTPYKDAKIMHKYLKKSAIIPFNDSGHFPYLDDAKKFSIIVKGYLKQITKEGNF